MATGMSLEHSESGTFAEGPGRRRVLLVDDHRDSRRMLGMMLELSGHQVLEAGDGGAGLSMAMSERPDVAIVDIALPGIDGYEVARRLRAHPGTRDIVLIALTGYGYEEDLRCAIEAGFDLHLVKPVESGRLADVVAQARRVERRRAARRS
jgi:two-component system, sensor histidine kinase